MSLVSTLRANWRVLALTVIVVLSLGSLLAPEFRATEGPTNLQYGIQLDGGPRIPARSSRRSGRRG